MENTKAKNVIIVVLVILLIGILGFLVYFAFFKTAFNTANSVTKTASNTIGDVTKQISEQTTKTYSDEYVESLLAKITDLETKNKKLSEKENEYIPLSVFTAVKKTKSSIDGTAYKLEDNIYKEGDFFTVRIEKGTNIEFVSTIDNSSYIEYGMAKKTSEIKVKKNYAANITGFDKQVVDVEFGVHGQMISEAYIIFLMEDGTLEYATLSHLIKNLTVEGNIKKINNIERLHLSTGNGQTVLALDNKNNLYDIGYILGTMKVF